MWRCGHLTDDDRPDKLGAMFWNTVDSGMLGWVLQISEVRPGSLDNPRAQALIAQETKRQLVFVRTRQGVQVQGPPEMMARWNEARRRSDMIQERLKIQAAGAPPDHPASQADAQGVAGETKPDAQPQPPAAPAPVSQCQSPR